MNTRRVAAGNGAVTVREWGAANGQPLVFWHGLNPFGALALNEAGPAWAADGFRVVAVAAPGIADDGTLPDPAAYRPTRLADLVVSVADELGLGRFVFVGWSWGASIGVHLGVRHTSRLNALVLLDAGHTDIPEDHGETLRRDARCVFGAATALSLPGLGRIRFGRPRASSGLARGSGRAVSRGHA